MSDKQWLAHKITTAFIRHHLTKKIPFQVGEPCKLTCGKETKSATVKYTTKSFIGGEDLIGKSAYVGKKGHLIVIFKQYGSHADEHVECSLDDACRYIEGFAAFMETVNAEVDESNMFAAKMEGESLEIVADSESRRDKYKEDPLFGSW